VDTSYPSTDLSAIASGPSGYVVVGTEWGETGQRPTAWFSADGLAWERAANPFAGSRGHDVIATRSGFVMAGGDDARSGESTRASFWASQDGRSWAAQAADEALGDHAPLALAEGGDGTIVAVGYQFAEPFLAPSVWASQDGLAWVEIPATGSLASWAAPGPTPSWEGALQGTIIQDVAAVGGGFAAAGKRWGLEARSPDDGDRLRITWQRVVWRSADGLAWDLLPDVATLPREVTNDLQFGMSNISELDQVWLMLGETGELGATVWVAPRP
jgi:hypothetical protein